MADRTWGGVFFNFVLVVVFVSLFTAIMHSKNINKALNEDIQQAQVDFQVFKDKSEICFKQLDTKVADIGAKEKQVADLTSKLAEGEKQVTDLNNEKNEFDTKIKDLTSKLATGDKQISDLTNNVNTLTEEKKALDTKIADLTAQLEKANKDLEAAKAQPPPKEEAKTEAPKAEAEKAENEKAAEPTKS